jgi:hypothetical protein
MSEFKPGARLRSAVCTTEVVVIAATGSLVLSCGGAPLLAEGETATTAATLDATAATGTLLGKRYTNDTGSLEVLCVKPGAGALAADDVLLQVKGAKPLPSSD